MRVPWMQAGGRFVKDQTGSVKLRTEGRGQPSALKFSAGQSSRRTIERQISNTDIIQTLQAGSNVRQRAFRDKSGFLGRQSTDAAFREVEASARPLALPTRRIQASTVCNASATLCCENRPIVIVKNVTADGNGCSRDPRHVAQGDLMKCCDFLIRIRQPPEHQSPNIPDTLPRTN